MENDINKIYYLTSKDDNTLKQFFDRFYVLPRDKNYNDEELKFLSVHELGLKHEQVKTGKNGYIVFRRMKKLNNEQVEKIKNDTGSYRAKAKKYNLSVGTICKIMNDKY